MNRRSFFAAVTGALLARPKAIAEVVKQKPIWRPLPAQVDALWGMKEVLFCGARTLGARFFAEHGVFDYYPTAWKGADITLYIDETGPITETEYSLVRSRVPGGCLLTNPQGHGEGWLRKCYMEVEDERS